jgi:hypothetical protein
MLKSLFKVKAKIHWKDCFRYCSNGIRSNLPYYTQYYQFARKKVENKRNDSNPRGTQKLSGVSSKKLVFLPDEEDFSEFTSNSNIYFHDFTNYIQAIDELFKSQPTLLLFRNRRMGKSLLLSGLDYYYNIRYADEYAKIFEHLKIYNYQSKDKNTFCILRLDFSRLSIDSYEGFVNSFERYINQSVMKFVSLYQTKNVEIVKEDAMYTLQSLVDATEEQKGKMMILIDEYDASITRFFGVPQEMEKFKFKPNDNSKFINHYRNFFSTLKSLLKGTKDYGLRRIFITGVSPQSLNDFTSGFNIGLNLTLLPEFANILGYPEKFVEKGLREMGLEKKYMSSLMDKLRQENNGYRYAYENNIQTMYNPAKINYIMKRIQAKIQNYQTFDENQKSFYQAESANYLKYLLDFPIPVTTKPAETILHYLSHLKHVHTVLAKILSNDNIELVEHVGGPDFSYWNFENEHQFLSYLYYHGALTYAKFNPHKILLTIPNNAAKREYIDRFKELIGNTQLGRFSEGLAKLFSENDITVLTRVYQEDFLIKHTNAGDMPSTHTYESDLQWGFFLSLLNSLHPDANEIRRELPLAITDELSYYVDLAISPQTYPDQIILIELKHVKLDYLVDGLIKFCETNINKHEVYKDFLNSFNNYKNTNEAWYFMKWTQKYTFYKAFFQEGPAMLTDDEILNLPISKYKKSQNQDVNDKQSQNQNVNDKHKQSQNQNVNDILKTSIKQLSKYENQLHQAKELKAKKKNKYVIIRIGPTRLISRKIDS